MKTAEEYSDDVVKLWSKFDWDEISFIQFKNGIKNYIEQAQKEAYNQALEDAAENAACEYKNDYLTGEIDKQSILKLKK
jgi:hypothetical protein